MQSIHPYSGWKYKYYRSADSILSYIGKHSLAFYTCLFGVLHVIFGTIAFHLLEGWSYLESFYFCVETFTTLGFGDRSVSSRFLPRLVNILYAWMGMILVSLLLGVYASYTIKLRTKELNENIMTRDDQAKRDVRLFLYGVLILVLFQFFGTFFFMYTERWDFMTALYFTNTTLATIGYGDVLPTTHSSRLGLVVFICTGVVWTHVLLARAVSLVVWHSENWYNQLRKKFFMPLDHYAMSPSIGSHSSHDIKKNINQGVLMDYASMNGNGDNDYQRMKHVHVEGGEGDTFLSMGEDEGASLVNRGSSKASENRKSGKTMMIGKTLLGGGGTLLGGGVGVDVGGLLKELGQLDWEYWRENPEMFEATVKNYVTSSPVMPVYMSD